MAQGNIYQAMQLEELLSEQWYNRWIIWSEETARKGSR